MKHIYPIKSGMLRNVGTQIDGKDGNDKKLLDNSVVVTRVISAKLGGRFDFSKKNYGRRATGTSTSVASRNVART